MPRATRVVVVGFDGLEPTIVDSMIADGALPHFARLASLGRSSRVATTCPAQTPVAWSTFATGVNPGGHGIFDFLGRDPKTYVPRLALNRYEQTNAFVPPKVVNCRRGQAVWDVLSAAGIPSAVIRCPCTYPPDALRGRMLSGLGVPDLRGALGIPTLFTSEESAPTLESESVVPVRPDERGLIHAHFLGPLSPKTRQPTKLEFTIEPRPASGTAVVRSPGDPSTMEIREEAWSDWLKVKFKLGLFQSARGMLRLYLVRQSPTFELYCSPVNFDPASPLFPISSPPEYAQRLSERLRGYYTTGMVEEHTGLNNGRIDEAAFLAQCGDVWREREAMLIDELAALKEGFVFCLFDTPDRVQHMFWRFREPGHPANRGEAPGEWQNVVDEEYRRCDATLGRVLEQVDDNTLLIVLSDHGFNSFQRGMNINTWLHGQGLLQLKSGSTPGREAGDFFRQVNWAKTKAYSLGLGGMYLNIQGREAQGIVAPDEAPKLKREIQQALSDLADAERGQTAVRSAVTSEEAYSGPYRDAAPDLFLNFAAGYRASWDTALGGVPEKVFEDNRRRWAGDHIIDPVLVPGVLLMNRPYRGENARLLDMAPTILDALGAPKGQAMEGDSLFA